MNYIVMDLEFNQAFNFQDGTDAEAVPECPFEIMQIGLVKLDETFNILEMMELNIRPSIYKRIHPFVGKITGLTHRDLYADALSFPQSFDEIRAFIGSSENIFAVWGGADVKLLLKNIIYHKLPTSDIPIKFIDVQALASHRLNATTGMSIGLKTAVTTLGIEQDRPFHNALSDALYTAQVFDIVRGEETNFEKYIRSVGPDRPRKRGSDAYDIAALYRECEKLFGRKLTPSYRKIVRKIYEMGHEGRFK